METAREKAISIIMDLPSDISLDEIIDHCICQPKY